MMTLFKGLDRAYGTYSLVRSSKTDKNKILGEAITKHAPVTEQLWEDHLAGRTGIGIVPIRDDSMCFFGAIDVDVYDLDYVPTLKLIEDNELPLIPCKTKSGGLHLYTFLSEATPASLVRQKLSHYAALLGFAGSEIYPRQNEVLSERGDIGQWINMPYFDAENTVRFALDKNNEGLSIKQFVERALASRKTMAEFEAFTVALLPDLSDGPPCLQYLVTRGFVAGTRNDGLYNLGVYLKKQSPDSWAQLLNDFNIKFFDPPLLSNEVEGVVKSLKKKEYDYSCSKAPLKPHCNSGLCRTRKFGVGALLDMPVLTALTKYDTNPPIWFVDVDGGGRLELETNDLQNQMRFQKICLDSLNVLTPIVKPGVWHNIIKALLDKVSIIEATEDSSPSGQLKELLETYCISLVKAKKVDELLIGKPWTSQGRTYFKLSDFLAFLDRKKFKAFTSNKITAILKDIGGEAELMKIRGKNVNIWSIPQFSEPDSVLEPEIDEPATYF
jgi:hypothetical protein